MGMPDVILERKVKPDGSVREYTCELVARRPGLLIARFKLPSGGEPFRAPLAIPAGSVSYGWFWARRPYNLYRMFGPGGGLVAHRFDAVAAVKFLAGAVEYRDLVLDWWVAPDESILEEDRDELDMLAASGRISPDDVAAANVAAYQVLSRYRHIIDEVAALERKLHIEPRGAAE